MSRPVRCLLPRRGGVTFRGFARLHARAPSTEQDARRRKLRALAFAPRTKPRAMPLPGRLRRASRDAQGAAAGITQPRTDPSVPNRKESLNSSATAEALPTQRSSAKRPSPRRSRGATRRRALRPEREWGAIRREPHTASPARGPRVGWRRPFLAEKLARPRGFEPLTPRSVVWCSIQLSYGRNRRRRRPPGRPEASGCTWRRQDSMCQIGRTAELACR